MLWIVACAYCLLAGAIIAWAAIDAADRWAKRWYLLTLLEAHPRGLIGAPDGSSRFQTLAALEKECLIQVRETRDPRFMNYRLTERGTRALVEGRRRLMGRVLHLPPLPNEPSPSVIGLDGLTLSAWRDTQPQ